MKSLGDINRFIDELCHYIGNGEYVTAFDLIRKNTIIDSAKIDVLKTQTEVQLNLINSRFGKEAGFEEVGEQILGESLIKKTVLQKYNIIPLKWELIFYKPASEWMLINLQFNEDFASLFK